MSTKTFAFGKNWTNFLKYLNEERIKNAALSLSDFLGINNLKGKTFLDIGCGSGLFSYAAYRLEAKRIFSFDVDPFSVECCKYLHKKASNPSHWEIARGSVLDTQFLSQLEKFDIVYSWGVLHHTGNMWEAIRNSAKLVKEGGFYYIAIYNKTEGLTGSKTWLRIKKVYNFSPKPIKWLFEYGYISLFFMTMVLKFQDPIKYIQNYQSYRGMSFKTDVVDWIGGYPYEYATKKEIIDFIGKNFSDFNLIKTEETQGVGNNWFLFQRSNISTDN